MYDRRWAQHPLKRVSRDCGGITRRAHSARERDDNERVSRRALHGTDYGNENAMRRGSGPKTNLYTALYEYQ